MTPKYEGSANEHLFELMEYYGIEEIPFDRPLTPFDFYHTPPQKPYGH